MVTKYSGDIIDRLDRIEEHIYKFEGRLDIVENNITKINTQNDVLRYIRKNRINIISLWVTSTTMLISVIVLYLKVI